MRQSDAVYDTKAKMVSVKQIGFLSDKLQEMAQKMIKFNSVFQQTGFISAQNNFVIKKEEQKQDFEISSDKIQELDHQQQQAQNIKLDEKQ